VVVVNGKKAQNEGGIDAIESTIVRLDRFLAEHAAVFYYWVLVLFFFLSPSLAYNFSELIEAHAVDTYTEFLRANEDLLKQLPPPKIAESYYLADNLYMFDE